MFKDLGYTHLFEHLNLVHLKGWVLFPESMSKLMTSYPHFMIFGANRSRLL